MRRIVTKIPNFDELNLPPQVEKLAELPPRASSIVSGTTGSGKSTTLAAIIGKINRTRSRADHHRRRPDRVPARERQEPGQPGRGRHRQRELRVRPARHDASGPRHDPDRRNSRHVLADHRAAGRRHRPPGLHDRPRHQRPDDRSSAWSRCSTRPRRSCSRRSSALNLIAVVCQRLAKKRDGKGRVPVVEIMMATPLVRKYILDGEFEKLKGARRQPRGRQPELRPAPDGAVPEADHRRRRGQAPGEQRGRAEPGPARHQQQRHEAAANTINYPLLFCRCEMKNTPCLLVSLSPPLHSSSGSVLAFTWPRRG